MDLWPTLRKEQDREDNIITQEVTYNAYIVILGKVINIPIVYMRLSYGRKNFSNNHCYLHMGNNWNPMIQSA